MNCVRQKLANKSDGRKEQYSALYPCSLALGRLASAGTTVVDAVLFILRGRRQVVDHVSGIPDLVGVTVVAAPYLNLAIRRAVSFGMIWKM